MGPKDFAFSILKKKLTLANLVLTDRLVTDDEKRKVLEFFEKFPNANKYHRSRDRGAKNHSVIKTNDGQYIALLRTKGKHLDVDRFGTRLGVNEHCVVKLGQDIETGQWVTVKIEKKPELFEIEKTISEKLSRLLGWLRRVVPDKSANLREYEKYYLISEVYDGLDLFDTIRNNIKQLNALQKVNDSLFKSHLRAYFKALLKINIGSLAELNELHSQHSILQADMKPENIIWNTDGNSKIIDFGLSKIGTLKDPQNPASLASVATFITGTLGFLPPEHFPNTSPAQQNAQKQFLNDSNFLKIIAERFKKTVRGTYEYNLETEAWQTGMMLHECWKDFIELYDYLPFAYQSALEAIFSVIDQLLQADPSQRGSTENLLPEMRRIEETLNQLEEVNQVIDENFANMSFSVRSEAVPKNDFFEAHLKVEGKIRAVCS